LFPKDIKGDDVGVCDGISSLNVSPKAHEDCIDLSIGSVPSLTPCSVIICNEDDASSLCLSLNPPATTACQNPKPRQLKSILKFKSGPAAAVNPKSLRRGFQSMMELPTMPLPEDSVCEANIVDTVPVNMLRQHSMPISDNDELDNSRHNGPGLTRKLSFSSEGPRLKRIESREDIDEREKSDLWFQKEEISTFVGQELTRRRRMGIESQGALCPAAEEDEVEAFRRMASKNMPRGIRR